MNHEEERQLLMQDLELLIDELKPEHRLKMLSIVMRYWQMVEKAEATGAYVDNAVIVEMIRRLRDR
jgi:hypothetical protein